MKLQLPAKRTWGNAFRANPIGELPRHMGLDFGWLNGDQVMAAAPGRVVYVYSKGTNASNSNKGWGNRIIVEHAPGVRTTYNHLLPGSITVKVGDTVTAGQLLGRMGETGLTNGRHLHFELELNGQRVDPVPYFTKDLPGTERPMAPNERQVASTAARRRAEPTTASADMQPAVQPSTVETLTGWIYGENVRGEGNIWFRGEDGYWRWANLYTSQSTVGLTDLNEDEPGPEFPPIDDELIRRLIESNAELVSAVSALTPEVSELVPVVEASERFLRTVYRMG